MRLKFSPSENIRNFIFGVEDSIVSTIGLVSGIAVAGIPRNIVLMTGVVLIFVEAFSMGVGTLLSDNSVKEFKSHSEISLGSSIFSSFVMFFSYLFSGFIVLSPYIFFEKNIATPFSIVLSLIVLFMLGILSAHFSRTSLIKKGFLMVFIGGLAILVGIFVSHYFDI